MEPPTYHSVRPAALRGESGLSAPRDHGRGAARARGSESRARGGGPGDPRRAAGPTPATPRDPATADAAAAA